MVNFDSLSHEMRLAIFVLSLIPTFCTFGQKKVEWSFSYDASSGVVHLNAHLAEGWHLYSQHIANDIGPVPTAVHFDPNKDIKLIGKVDEPKPVQEYDENFEALLDYFEHEVNFTQRVSVKSSTILTGAVTYMACNSTQCLPPTDEYFSIELKKD
jgi:hypothetical protein